MGKTYVVLLVDKKHASCLVLRGNAVEKTMAKRIHEYVPQKVKHGDDTWDAPDKIFRHIEDHLHRYLQEVMRDVVEFVGKEHIDSVFIGSHRTLFPLITKHLPKSFQQKVQGYVVMDMKAPVNRQLEKMQKAIRISEQTSSLVKIS